MILPGLILVSLLVSATAQSQPRLSRPAQVGLSPQYHFVDLDQGHRTYSYQLVNLGDVPIRASVDVVNWTLDENHKIVRLPPSETSLDQWTIINPRQLQVPPRESRTVRFSVRPAFEVNEGEYRIAIVFTEQPLEKAIEEDEKSTAVMTTRFSLLSAVYITTGRIQRIGTLETLSLTRDSLTLTINSTGNGHVRLQGNYSIWPATATDSGKVTIDSEQPVATGKLSTQPVLENTRRALTSRLDTPLANGLYEVRLTGTLGEQPLQDAYVVEVNR